MPRDIAARKPLFSKCSASQPASHRLPNTQAILFTISALVRSRCVCYVCLTQVLLEVSNEGIEEVGTRNIDPRAHRLLAKARSTLVSRLRACHVNALEVCCNPR